MPNDIECSAEGSDDINDSKQTESMQYRRHILKTLQSDSETT